MEVQFALAGAGLWVLWLLLLLLVWWGVEDFVGFAVGVGFLFVIYYERSVVVRCREEILGAWDPLDGGDRGRVDGALGVKVSK